jgi:hypothetical protein
MFKKSLLIKAICSGNQGVLVKRPGLPFPEGFHQSEGGKYKIPGLAIQNKNRGLKFKV